MSKFLDDFLTTMPSTQRKKLMDLLTLKKQTGIIRSDYELEKELERLLNELEERSGSITFQCRLQEERIDSEKYNKNLEEIAFDLATIFEASEIIDRLISDNKTLGRSLLLDIQKKVYLLKSKLEKYKLFFQNQLDQQEGIYEQFRLPDLTEVHEDMLKIFRTDRFEENLPSSYNAEHIGDSIQLAGVESYDQIKTSFGKKLANISIVNRIGSASSNENHTIEKAIDGSLDTFWAESVLADEPIVQDIAQIWNYQQSDYPKDGAMCEIDIKLNGVTTVSDIHFDPFCAYPLEIVSIYGYENEDKTGKIYELISPEHPKKEQRSKKSVSMMSFQFPSVDVSKIRILLRQENYVKENFLDNKDEKRNLELWEKLTNSTDFVEDFKDPNETIASFNRRNEMAGWTAYLEHLKEWASSIYKFELVDAAKKALEIIRLGDFKNPLLLSLQALTSEAKKELQEKEELQVKWYATSKLAYVYGAYNISIFGRKYRNRSVYVSKPLNLSGNTMRVSIETEEAHHHIPQNANDFAQITDIEYYVTNKKHPMMKDWISLLPTNKSKIKGELLLGNEGNKSNIIDNYEKETGKAIIKYTLRFPVLSSESITLRRNGSPIPNHAFVLGEDGRQFGIKQEYFSASSLYTVDYVPHESAYLAQLDQVGMQPSQYIDKNGETGEIFEKPDHNNCLFLSHTPYLKRESMFIFNEDKQSYQQKEDSEEEQIQFPVIVRINGIEFKNITNYASQTYEEKDLFDNGGKAFAHIGNRIILGQPIDRTPLTNISVDYFYLTTDVRLKAIFRRNSMENESITPSLYSYRIRSQSLS